MKIALLFILMCCWENSKSQNLVGNFSFEEYSQCPYADNLVPFAIGWENWCLTPDYYNGCAPENGAVWYSVPNNLPNGENYQMAASGNAYAGFFAYPNRAVNDPPNARDLIARELADTLISGKKYFVSMNVSLALTSAQNCACNNLGVKFTTTSYSQYANQLISPLVNNVAHVYSSQLITDTVNWTTISGPFQADSSYRYIVIGNFFTDDNCDTLVYGGGKCYSYYMVDHIKVVEDTATGETGYASQHGFQIFPNPATNRITILYSHNPTDINFRILTLEGKTIKEIIRNNSQGIDISDLPAGIYTVQAMVNHQRSYRFFIKQ